MHASAHLSLLNGFIHRRVGKAPGRAAGIVCLTPCDSYAGLNPLTRKTCPNFPPFSSLPIPEERSLFTTKNPFIYIDSACSSSRHEYPKSQLKTVCMPGSLFPNRNSPTDFAEEPQFILFRNSLSPIYLRLQNQIQSDYRLLSLIRGIVVTTPCPYYNSQEFQHFSLPIE